VWGADTRWRMSGCRYGGARHSMREMAV
jgi:hypothetical protein